MRTMPRLGAILCFAMLVASISAAPQTPTPQATPARTRRPIAVVQLATSTTLPAKPQYDAKEILAGLKPGTYAVFETDHGNFVSILFTEKAPRTTTNFIGLAEGVRPFRDPMTRQEVKRPYYDNLIFHRVIRNGLIQTGDPTGRGNGGTGYNFDDEFVPELKHDKIGVMSMATQGPGTNTNGGQFAIALRVRADLDMKYSVFGEIVKGIEVAQAIATVPLASPQPGVARSERPAPPEPKIKTLRIYRVEEGGGIVNSPPPPKIDIRARPATARNNGPATGNRLTSNTLGRGRGVRGGA